MAEVDPDSPTVRLTIRTEALPLTQQTGRILDRLARAFDALPEVRNIPARERPRLRLINIEVGSLVADFLLIAAAVVTARDFLGIAKTFTGRLARAARVMAGLEEGEVSNSERAAVTVLSAPIAKDNASQVTLQVVGDNNTINFVEITPEIWDQIEQRRPRRTRQRVSAGTGMAAGSGAAHGGSETVHHLQAQDLTTAPPVLGSSTLTVQGAVSSSTASSPTLGGKGGLEDDDIAVNAPTLRGRAQFVSGAWQVLPEGGSVLLPVRNDTIMQGRSADLSYPVEGRVITHSRAPVGFRVLVISDARS